MKPAEPMVLLPYSQLEDLLKASRELPEIRQEIRRLQAQHAALKGQFLEMMDLLRALQETI